MPAMSSTPATLTAALLATLLTAGAAWADTVGTPVCQRDLAAANALINGIAAREKQFVKGDLAKNCALLRQNLVDLTNARGPMDRCLSGHDHGENVGQIDDSIEDVRPVLADKCGK
jgi:hypothetical protein